VKNKIQIFKGTSTLFKHSSGIIAFCELQTLQAHTEALAYNLCLQGIYMMSTVQSQQFVKCLCTVLKRQILVPPLKSHLANCSGCVRKICSRFSIFTADWKPKSVFASTNSELVIVLICS
jgi:hypothetical protein